MDLTNVVFISHAVCTNPKNAAVLEDAAARGVKVCVLALYKDREEILPALAKDNSYLRGIIIETADQAQNYHNLKKGKTKAGSIDVVLYRPDFTNPSTKKTLRAICAKGWCDGIIGIANSGKPDGLHKKDHLLTQVECAQMAKNSISLVFDFNTLTFSDSAFFRNRVHQILFLARKYSVATGVNLFYVDETLGQVRTIPKQFLDAF